MSDAAVKSHAGKVLNFPICKVDDEKREVWGIATSEALDMQNEIVDYEGSVRAFDKWTSQFEKISGGNSLGNVREMHGSKSVGKLIAYHPDPERRQIWVGAKITQSIEGDDAWRKVKDHVLNGFSIGAPKASRQVEYHGNQKVNRVTEYELAELSLVDNPACPEAFFEQIKLATTVDGPAYEMALLKRFEPDAKPSGEDWKPAPAAIQKTVELNPDTFVDGSGDVWTRLNGRVTKKENAMSDPKTLEKAGKKIGPDHKPPGVPPGPKADATADTSVTPAPSGTSQGKAAPTSNPPLDGDGANDGRNAGNGEQEKQIKSEAPAPDGQGKAADAGDRKEPDEDDMKAAKFSEADAKVAASGFSYCSMCGGEMKSSGGSDSAPYHKRCIEQKKSAAAGASKAAGVAGGVESTEGLVKTVSAMFEPIRKTMNDNFEALSKRLERIEKSPAPGGPHRTELPPGVGAVDKAAGSEPDGDGVVKALEATLPLVNDPMARQAISMQIAKAAMRAAQNGGGKQG